MDLTNRLQEIFSKLGYFGTIPIPLQKNPSTSFIWEQFIRNVKPKNHVDTCRKNIIINRLQRKLSVEDSKDYPIQEIQVYNELKAVKENIEIIKKRIQEKQNREAFLREANKSNYLQISSLKDHIEEKKIKLHALKLKATDMRNRLKLMDATKTKGIALVSDDNSLSPENVTNILKTLIETIEKLSPKCSSSHWDKYIMSSYHSISRIQSPRKKCHSTIKKNKVNIPRFQRFSSCVNMSAAKSLFTDSFRETDINFENVIKEDPNNSTFIDQSPKLLPDSCFDFKADDEFLMSFRSTDDILSEKEYINPLKKESLLDNSMKCQSISQMRSRRDYFENAYTDDHLIQKIDEVLHGASVRTIWTSICNLREELLRKSRFELESSKANVRFKIDATNEDDISKLNFIYVKYSLLALKSKKKIKNLIHDIREKKSDIEVQLEKHIGENRLEGLELMLENVKLKAAIEFIQKEINYTDKSDCIITLNSLNNKIDKVKAELFAKMKEVEGFMQSKEYLMQQLKKCQKDTALCVRRSNQFINDTVWIEGLAEKVHSKEINTFRDFPLDYNKKFCFTDGSFYMDSMRKIILDKETSSDTLYMLHSIIDHPQYPPERIFIESLKKKYKFQVMSSLKTSKVQLEQKNYSLQEFQEQEKYVDKICENLMTNIKSWKAYQVLNSSSRMKSNMNLWLDMPFKRFISKERKVDGKSYKYYEEKYEYLRNSK